MLFFLTIVVGCRVSATNRFRDLSDLVQVINETLLFSVEMFLRGKVAARWTPNEIRSALVDSLIQVVTVQCRSACRRIRRLQSSFVRCRRRSFWWRWRSIRLLSMLSSCWTVLRRTLFLEKQKNEINWSVETEERTSPVEETKDLLGEWEERRSTCSQLEPRTRNEDSVKICRQSLFSDKHLHENSLLLDFLVRWLVGDDSSVFRWTSTRFDDFEFRLVSKANIQRCTTTQRQEAATLNCQNVAQEFSAFIEFFVSSVNESSRHGRLVRRLD